MPTVLITGSNRGLGLEFTRQYCQAGWQVLAACRDPAAAPELAALAERYPALELHRLDVRDFDAIDRLAKALAGRPIDVLLNNAGVLARARLRSRIRARPSARWTTTSGPRCSGSI